MRTLVPVLLTLTHALKFLHRHPNQVDGGMGSPESPMMDDSAGPGVSQPPETPHAVAVVQL